MKIEEVIKQLESILDHKPIRDIPMEVLKKADLAMKRSKNANEKYLKLMGIKPEPPEEG